MVVALAGAGIGVWRATHATGTAMMALSPSTKAILWNNRTPFAESINFSNATNVGAYQFRLQWNPGKIQWVSSSLPAATWLQSTGRGALCSIVYDLTPTPTGTPPTATSTFTPAVPTATRTPTATPAGNITFGCATLGTPGQVGVPAGPNVGVAPVEIANFQFKSIATAETSDQIKLTNVIANNVLSTPIAPITVVNANIKLVTCHDLDGDHIVSILDISLLAAHYLATSTVPRPPGWTWNPVYDVDGDNVISIIDLGIVAAAYGLTCSP
jgi:hypothetical protein